MGMTLLTICIFLILICWCKCDERLTLTPAKPLLPDDKLVSSDGIFALGFFSPENSTAANLYVGIWYHDIPERAYVWVANRDNPIDAGLSGKLVLTNTSDLVLSDSRGRILWRTTNNITTGGDGAMALLLDTGNFVLRSPNYTQIWQSYDHPTDTILHNFKLWTNYKTHTAVHIVAWKGPQDPSTGEFVLSGDTSTGLQVLTWRGTSKYWRSGLWSGATASDKYGYMTSQIVDDGETIYSTYNTGNSTRRSHWKLDHTGDLMLRVWVGHSWVALFKRPDDGCRHYGSCGPFGYCDMSTGECGCLDGFEPAEGFSANFSKGCVIKEALTCRGDHFMTLSGMKVPDNFVYVRNRSFEECTAECELDCSCTAYAYTNLSSMVATGGPSRCLVWKGKLVDIEKTDRLGGNLYLRLAGSPGHSSAVNNVLVFKIALPVITFLLILSCIYFALVCKSRGIQVKKEILKRPALGYLSTSQEVWDQNLELRAIRFDDIAAATNSFHDTNVLGKGGFGKVYKGTLEDGKEVAVKRLSKGSEQGLKHFRNEVVLIAKLQHKNLVRLLGCCIHEDEKLLIYEYLPNKSLDNFLFDTAGKSMLDWPRRFNIIKGVARGLLYLHQDSRTTIIHRDLKPSNILLDAEMNPKISDFGMARIFGGHELQESTKRVVGTYGYMPPEYAMEGIFSVKSDTYSFGILLLEVISGLKISSPHHLVMDFSNLISCAWNLWVDGKLKDFIDTTITESDSFDEMSRCIHVGLLCVQDSTSARPHMSSVVSMLDSEAMPRAAPKQPMYFAQINYETSEAVEESENSANGLSLTALQGR